MAARLRELSRCRSVNPVANRDVIVVVTETHGRDEADRLDRVLAAIDV